MNIEGFGEETFDILKNEIKSYLDIYRLNPKILKKYDAFRDKSISNGQEMFLGFDEKVCLNKIGKNLLQSIENSKENSLEKLLYGLGIPFVGKELANVLSAHFRNLDNLSKATLEEISSIDGIGDVTSKKIVEFFLKNPNLNDELKKLGINTKYINHNDFVNKKKVVCCITGKFELYTRDELINILNSHGIDVSSSITKNVSYLICGNKPGSKFERAKELEIKIIFQNQIDSILI